MKKKINKHWLMHILTINDSLQIIKYVKLPPPLFFQIAGSASVETFVYMCVWNNEILYYDAPMTMLFWYIVIIAAPVMCIASWFHFNLAQVLKQYLASV